VKAEGIKVVLTGEGADEVFLGYDIFKETLLRQQWPQLTAPEEKQRRLAQLYPYLAHFQQNTTALAGVFDQFAQERNAGLFSHEIRFHNSRLGLRLLQGEFGNGLTWLQQLLSSHAAELAGQTPLQRAQWLEFKTLLAGYLLSSQGDRMSFAHGVETRMPFLDPHLVQWAWTLPTAWKLSPTGDEKYLLKQAFADLLPAQILQRPKQPYRAPDAAVFLAADPPDYLELLLSPHELQKLDLLDNRFAQQFVAKIRRTAPEQISQRENQTFLFLLSLALLHHQMIARQGVRPNTMHVWPPASIEAQFVRRIDGRQQMPKALSS
jgi:asparagine synthase (glutamine-hydrolysing)